MPKALQEGESGPNKPVDVSRISVSLVKAVVGFCAVATLLFSGLSTYYVLTRNLEEHIHDEDIHVPRNHYKQHGLPVGVHDMEMFKVAVAAQIQHAVDQAAAPLDEKIEDVQMMLEDMSGDRRLRERATRRRQSRDAP